MPCPAPLLAELDYGMGGYIAGRYCAVGVDPNGTACCLPCPIQNWVYPAEFKVQVKIPNYLAIVSLILCIFLLLSFTILPVEKTRRHYLSAGLLIPMICMSLSFVISIGSEAQMCFDDITPNDMHTKLSCAWSGALLAGGGIGGVFWVFLRSLCLHIRIVWDRDPKTYSRGGSIFAGIAVPAVLLSALLGATGVSYRFGPGVCLPNHPHAIASYWAWLVGFAIAGSILKGATGTYCAVVYFRMSRRMRAQGSHNSGQNRAAAKYSLEAWEDVKKYCFLEAFGSLFVLTTTMTFFLVFLIQDTKLSHVYQGSRDLSMPVQVWITCLILNKGNKEQCLKYTGDFTVPPQAVLASLILASLVGVLTFVSLARASMFAAWKDLRGRGCHGHQRARTPPLTSLGAFRMPDFPSNEQSCASDGRPLISSRSVSIQPASAFHARPSLQPGETSSPRLFDVPAPCSTSTFLQETPSLPSRSQSVNSASQRSFNGGLISRPVPGSFKHVDGAFISNALPKRAATTHSSLTTGSKSMNAVDSMSDSSRTGLSMHPVGTSEGVANVQEDDAWESRAGGIGIAR